MSSECRRGCCLPSRSSPPKTTSSTSLAQALLARLIYKPFATASTSTCPLLPASSPRAAANQPSPVASSALDMGQQLSRSTLDVLLTRNHVEYCLIHHGDVHNGIPSVSKRLTGGCLGQT